jgi:putative membrane protein
MKRFQTQRILISTESLRQHTLMSASTHEALRTPNELAEDRTELAVQRTAMAADRSLMAWIRTGLSMISFGFTIYKLLQAFQASGEILPRANTPRNLGLFLTGLGTAALLAGTIEYFQTLKDMHILYARRIFRPAFIMALGLAAMGLFMFTSIFIRVL